VTPENLQIVYFPFLFGGFEIGDAMIKHAKLVANSSTVQNAPPRLAAHFFTMKNTPTK
jgi:hypothetical protein